MPYPNEHAARIKSPALFPKMRRQNNKFGSGIHVIWGITKDNKVVIQAIRFDKKKFTSSQSKKWLKENKYSYMTFEEASNAALNLDDENIRSDIADAIGDIIQNQGRTSPFPE